MTNEKKNMTTKKKKNKKNTKVLTSFVGYRLDGFFPDFQKSSFAEMY